jgi:hypothetical protein
MAVDFERELGARFAPSVSRATDLDLEGFRDPLAAGYR